MIKKEWGKSPAKIPRWGVFKSKIPHIFLSTIYQLFIQMKFLTNEHNQTQPDKKNRAYQGFRGLCCYEQTQPDSTRQAPLSSHNPEVVGSSPAPATIRKVPNSLRIGYFLFVFTPEMFDFSKAQKALFLLIYQQFINKCYLKALKTPKVGDWGLFFRSPYIYYKNISYRYIKIIPQFPKIPRKP